MAKQDKLDRRAVAAQIRDKQKSDDRRRGFLIVGACLAIAVLIIGAAAYKPIKDAWDARAYEDTQLSEIGADASACQEITTKPAKGQQDHVDPGTEVEYADAPPAFGQHWSEWDTMERKFYTAADRPDLGELIHNLEHGYTMLWYDETAAEDDQAMESIRAIASKFDDDDNMRHKFKALPWTAEDGDAFPDGQHIALTHWSVGGAGETDPEKQVGVFQYCSEPSGAALEEFMEQYPYMDSPEPNAV